jgi:uncharacterized membrane protein YdbT with pleckstrin-like domain
MVEGRNMPWQALDTTGKFYYSCMFYKIEKNNFTMNTHKTNIILPSVLSILSMFITFIVFSFFSLLLFAILKNESSKAKYLVACFLGLPMLFFNIKLLIQILNTVRTVYYFNEKVVGKRTGLFAKTYQEYDIMDISSIDTPFSFLQNIGGAKVIIKFKSTNDILYFESMENAEFVKKLLLDKIQENGTQIVFETI